MGHIKLHASCITNSASKIQPNVQVVQHSRLVPPNSPNLNTINFLYNFLSHFVQRKFLSPISMISFNQTPTLWGYCYVLLFHICLLTPLYTLFAPQNQHTTVFMFGAIPVTRRARHLGLGIFGILSSDIFIYRGGFHVHDFALLFFSRAWV